MNLGRSMAATYACILKRNKRLTIQFRRLGGNPLHFNGVDESRISAYMNTICIILNSSIILNIEQYYATLYVCHI
jgi:hypothetical protein